MPPWLQSETSYLYAYRSDAECVTCFRPPFYMIKTTDDYYPTAAFGKIIEEYLSLFTSKYVFQSDDGSAESFYEIHLLLI